MLVHDRDGWTAVVPIGFTLSIIGLVLVLIAGMLWPSKLVEVRRDRDRLGLVALLALGACGRSQIIDPMQQIGPHPVLPLPAEDLAPRVHFTKVVGWTAGEALPSLPA